MRIGVLVSGRGTNLAALLAAEAAGDLAPAEIVVVISNKPGVRALEIAAAAGKPSVIVDHKTTGAPVSLTGATPVLTGAAAREPFEQALLAALAAHQVEAVVLAGFMRVLTETFVSKFPHRIVNTHPALLPSFPGTDGPAQAIAHGAKVAGVTVHFVDTGVDTGPIIAQRAVPVLPGDTADTLHQRIQVEEHKLLPVVVRALAQGRLVCEGRTVVYRGDADADQLL